MWQAAKQGYAQSGVTQRRPPRSGRRSTLGDMTMTFTESLQRRACSVGVSPSHLPVVRERHRRPKPVRQRPPRSGQHWTDGLATGSEGDAQATEARGKGIVHRDAPVTVNRPRRDQHGDQAILAVRLLPPLHLAGLSRRSRFLATTLSAGAPTVVSCSGTAWLPVGVARLGRLIKLNLPVQVVLV